MLIVVAQNAEVHDRRIAERAVAVLDGGAADENGVCKRFLDGLGGDVEDQVLVAGLLELGNDIMQLGEVRAVYAKHDACRSGDLVHGCEVILVGAVEDGLVVLALGLDRRLGGVDVLGVDDDGAVADGRCLLDRARQTCRAVACVMDEDALYHLALADALVVDLLDALDASFCRLSASSMQVHSVAGEKVAVDKGLLMTHHDGLAAELVLADRDGLHGRRSGLGEKCDGLFGHVRALGDLNRALGDLHAERHTGGAAALFTVLLGR